MENLHPEQTGIRPSFVFFKENVNGSPVLGVEIGVDRGFNSAMMMTQMQNLSLYCVDPYDHMYTCVNETDELPKEAVQERRQFSIDLLAMFGDRCKRVFKHSTEAAQDFPDNYFDYIYIDGDHRYEPVKADLEAWYPKLKIGGVFGGHDYTMGCFGVTNAVNQFYSKLGVQFKTAPNGDFWSVKEK
jgi:hypothetical protein